MQLNHMYMIIYIISRIRSTFVI